MGCRYAKVGIITRDAVPLEGSQRALIGAMDRELSGSLMQSSRRLQQPLGTGEPGVCCGWNTETASLVDKVRHAEPRWTTRIDELLVVGSQRTFGQASFQV